MRLLLEDNGENPNRTRRQPRIRQRRRVRLLAPKANNKSYAIYNSQTGVGAVLTDGVPLSGLFKGLKKKVKAKKAFRAKKAEVKQANKMQRYENKQAAKTARQTGRQDRKQRRIVGKQEVQQARRDKKMNKSTQEEREFQTDAMQPKYNQGSDQLPQEEFDEVNGGQFESREAQMQVLPSDEEDFNEQEGDYSDFEEVDDNAYGNNFEQMEEDGTPLNGWLDTVFDLGKKVVNKVAGSKAGKAVQQSVVNKADYDRIKLEASDLRRRAEELAKQNITYGAVGLAAGVALGFGVAKITSKKR